ncbi:Secoisolariciresinol dehydrogenase [Bienertia sinuspersici]
MIKVMIADIQDDLGQLVYKNIGLTMASYIHYNVINETYVQNALDSIITGYGKLDIILSNSCIIVGKLNPNILKTHYPSEFEETTIVNLIGPFLGNKHVAQVMIPAQQDVSKLYSNLKGTWCKVEDVGNATLFLASDDSKFISGQNLIIDGGFRIVNSGLCMFV